MTPQWERDLDALVATRGRALLGYAYLLTRDQPDAADLVQDALLATFQRLGRRAGEVAGLEGYVRTAILRLYLNQARRRRHWLSLRPRLADRAPAPSIEDALVTEHSLAAALAGLSPMQRAAFALQYFGDLTVESIAAELGCSVGGAKRHLADARQRLAATLRPDLEGEPDA